MLLQDPQGVVSERQTLTHGFAHQTFFHGGGQGESECHGSASASGWNTGSCERVQMIGERQEIISPPLGLSRWLDGFCTTCLPQYASSAKAVEPPR